MIKYLYTFFISMLPIVELRGAIPVGAASGLPWYINYLLCCVGNMLPVPVILFFVEYVLNFMKKIRHLDKIAYWVEEKAEKYKGQVTKYATWGLLLFVAVPLPGTGAWTGSLVAAFIKMNKKTAFLSVLGGVLIAGVIITLISYGVLGFLSFLL
ncbi:MAG: small multidrug export protein [Ruminococcaceae bacterium]|nr:small multidrug export protein [Oscillospiraceae bacterium]